MVSQNSDPPASPDPAAPAGDEGKEPARIRSLDERFKSIEDKQDAQQSVLEKILDALPGGHAQEGDEGTTGATEPEPQRGNIGAEVRRQIAEAKQREEAEAKQREDGEWRKGIEDAIEALKPEQAPREPQTGIKGRLQRAMFGKAD